MSKIVEATGHAQASSVRRRNAARAHELRDEVAKAIEQAHKEGASPEKIQARINTARTKVTWKHDQAEREALAAKVEREEKIREEVRRKRPDLPPAEQEVIAQRMFREWFPS